MTNLMIRIVTLATCSIALIAAFSVTPVVAAGGSDLGGGEANYSGMDQPSAYPPSSYPKRSGNKATHAPKARDWQSANQWRAGATNDQGVPPPATLAVDASNRNLRDLAHKDPAQASDRQAPVLQRP